MALGEWKGDGETMIPRSVVNKLLKLDPNSRRYRATLDRWMVMVWKKCRCQVVETSDRFEFIPKTSGQNVIPLGECLSEAFYWATPEEEKLAQIRELSRGIS